MTTINIIAINEINKEKRKLMYKLSNTKVWQTQKIIIANKVAIREISRKSFLRKRLSSRVFFFTTNISHGKLMKSITKMLEIMTPSIPINFTKITLRKIFVIAAT